MKKWEDEVEDYYNRPKGYTGGTGVVRMMVGAMMSGSSLYAVNQGTLGSAEGLLYGLCGIALLIWGCEVAKND
jgi:hypothetical protein